MTGIHANPGGGTDFEIPEAGSYIARCYRMVDVGTHDELFQGKSSGMRRKLLVWFELLEDEDGGKVETTNGEPLSVMQRYTLSTSPKANLRKHIDAWRGKPLTRDEAEDFDVTVLLGQSCRLQITTTEKDGRTYANIASVGYTKKSLDGVNPTSYWSIAEPDMKAFSEMPTWLQAKIEEAAEWPGIKNSDAKVGTITDKGDVVIQDLPDGEVDLSAVPEKGEELDVTKIKF